MSFERQKKSVERVPIAALESFEVIDSNNLSEENIPKKVLELIREQVLNQPFEKVEVLRVSQEDGTDDYLVCAVDADESCNGIMLDTLGTDVIGETSFAGSTIRHAQNVIRVLGTITDEDMQGLGLGERRLVTINRYIAERFGRTLHSSSAPSSAAIRVWEGLKKKGLVEFAGEDLFQRYAFVEKI